MIHPIGSLYNNSTNKLQSFQQNQDKKEKTEDHDMLLVKQKEGAPISTNAKIFMDKVQNAVTVYPVKGMAGSKNANFYEFLTMGIVPYTIGSLMLMAVFNGANKFFSVNAAKKASSIGRKMAIGVVLYAVAKNISKKLIELPIKAKYGVDVNLPYKKVVNELPESPNDKDLKSYEYHKAYESVDFPRWDLFYNQDFYGDKRNSYYDHVAKKMGMGENLVDADQKVKPKIKELVIKSRTFTTIAQYLWAATAVGIAAQAPWDAFGNKKVRIHLSLKTLPEAIKRNLKDLPNFMKKFPDFIKRLYTAFTKSCVEFVKGGQTPYKPRGIAAKALLFSAIGITLAGNIATLVDFKKRKCDKAAAVSLIDDSKAKVVC